MRQWQSVVSMAGDGVGVGRRPGTSCAIRALVVIGRPKPQEQEGQGQGAEVLDLEGPGPPCGERCGSTVTHCGVGDGMRQIYPKNTTHNTTFGPPRSAVGGRRSAVFAAICPLRPGISRVHRLVRWSPSELNPPTVASKRSASFFF